MARSRQHRIIHLLAISIALAPSWCPAVEPISSNLELESGRVVLAPEPQLEPVTMTLGDSLEKAADQAYSQKDVGDCGTGQACQGSDAAGDKAAAAAYKNMFYDNDFSYLDDPCYSGWHLGENLKRIRLGNLLTVDVGGQYRLRLHNERNHRGLGLTGIDDDFLLQRTRFYVNAEVGDRVRFYGEMLDAYSSFEDLAPRPIEENRAELQNLFLDVVAIDGCSGKLTARIGREELQFGSQRLVSPLDWANTRRTFDGAKLMWRGEDWNIDGFFSRPAERIHPDNLNRLDQMNDDIDLYGVFTTRKEFGPGSLDLYWLALDNRLVGFNYNTIAARYDGGRSNWLYEVEGGAQFGGNADGSDHSAGFFTGGLGYKFCGSWSPILWGYFDWASGDDTIGNGFDHYYPLAHKYLGFMDFYGRRNLQDANLLATVQPTGKLKLVAWYHYFQLANINDVPYSVVMTPLSLSPSGSRDLGSELDLLAIYNITPRMGLLFGYSHFFPGDYYRTTRGLPYEEDANFLYTQFTIDF
jgi:hypothetical protein